MSLSLKECPRYEKIGMDSSEGIWGSQGKGGGGIGSASRESLN